MTAFKTIVVATDFSAHAEAAIDRACEIAHLCGADLHVLHVVSRVSQEPWVGYVAATWLEEDVDREKRDARTRLAGILANRCIVTPATVAAAAGDPAAAIIAYAREHRADLVVCGTHGRHGLNRLLLGSVAERIVHDAPCSVLTVKLEGAPPADIAGDAAVGQAELRSTG